MEASKTENSFNQRGIALRKPLLASAVVFFPSPLWAVLPTPVAPSTAPPAGDWIGLIQGYVKDGGLVLGLAISALGFFGSPIWALQNSMKLAKAKPSGLKWVYWGLSVRLC